MDPHTKTPSLIASTGNTYCSSIAESRVRESQLLEKEGNEPCSVRQATVEDAEWNYFKSAQWSPDGTSLLTNSADNTIRTFILPPTLLDEHTSSIILSPYTTHANPSPINCLSPYPAYNLSDPSTTFYLSTPSALPIRLTNSLSPTPTPTAAYPLISTTTEAYYTPSSLLWTSPTSFLAGTDCLIAQFDITNPGSGPVQSMPTIPSKRHKMKGGGVGMRGIVSALSLQPSSSPENSMVAAGTWTRWIGLYDTAGLGGTVAQWSIAKAADKVAGIGGMGVTQTAWSSCGRYLYVVERKSDGILVFDVRGGGKMLAWLEGRRAGTNQRLGVDVFEANGGIEVWAGGIDGVVRIWEGVGKTEGAHQRTWEWKAHDDPVTSTAVHSSGTVVATCSGQRSSSALVDCEADDDSEPSSSSEGSENWSDSSSNPDSENETETESESESESESERETSTYCPRSISRIPDNSIKVWKL